MLWFKMSHRAYFMLSVKMYPIIIGYRDSSAFCYLYVATFNQPALICILNMLLIVLLFVLLLVAGQVCLC